MKEAVIFYTERDFRDWFEANLDKVGVKRIILSQEPCPDYVVEMDNGEILHLLESPETLNAKIDEALEVINFHAQQQQQQSQ